jgi:hypothetical protein
MIIAGASVSQVREYGQVCKLERSLARKVISDKDRLGSLRQSISSFGTKIRTKKD